MNICFYYVLTLYFDQVIPDQFGQYKNLLFFLKPSFWGFDFNKDKIKSNLNWQEKTLKNSGGTHEIAEEDDDVKKERSESTREGMLFLL